MYTTNPFSKRSGDATWPAAFADLDAQLSAVFSSLPVLFEGLAAGSQSAARPLKPRWSEGDAAYVAELDMPGVKPEDISVEWKEGVVSVKATRQMASSVGSADKSSQRVYAARLRAPDEVNVGRIAARYANGLLSLTFPKSEKAKPRRIVVD